MAMTVSRLFLCRCGRYFVRHYGAAQNDSEPCPSCGGAAEGVAWPVSAVPQAVMETPAEPVVEEPPMPRWHRRRQKRGK